MWRAIIAGYQPFIGRMYQHRDSRTTRYSLTGILWWAENDYYYVMWDHDEQCEEHFSCNESLAAHGFTLRE